MYGIYLFIDFDIDIILFVCDIKYMVGLYLGLISIYIFLVINLILLSNLIINIFHSIINTFTSSSAMNKNYMHNDKKICNCITCNPQRSLNTSLKSSRTTSS